MKEAIFDQLQAPCSRTRAESRLVSLARQGPLKMRSFGFEMEEDKDTDIGGVRFETVDILSDADFMSGEAVEEGDGRMFETEGGACGLGTKVGVLRRFESRSGDDGSEDTRLDKSKRGGGDSFFDCEG